MLRRKKVPAILRLPDDGWQRTGDLPPSLQTVAIVLLFLVGLSGCLGEIARYPSPQRHDVVEAVRERLTDSRGLTLTQPVVFAVESRDDIKVSLARGALPVPAGKSMEDISLAYAKLGLVPHGTDLRTGSLNYYSDQAMAFYDSERKRIVYVGNSSDRHGAEVLPDGAAKIIAHELTHALQDQRFSLAERLQSSQTSDAALALRALAEGDAVVTEHAYSFGGLNKEVRDYILRALDATDAGFNVSNAPTILADKLSFQYRAGARFVLHFIGDSGWSPINSMYKHPPLSTKQILHPHKYFPAPDPPARITLAHLSGLFPAEWTRIEDDTLGELMVQCLVKQFLDPEVAATAAIGWDGDRFIGFRKGESAAYIWVTAWESITDAREFYDAHHKILSLRHGPVPHAPQFYIEKRGRMVISIDGMDRDHIKTVIDNIWRTVEIQKVPFQPPKIPTLTNLR